LTSCIQIYTHINIQVYDLYVFAYAHSWLQRTHYSRDFMHCLISWSHTLTTPLIQRTDYSTDLMHWLLICECTNYFSDLMHWLLWFNGHRLMRIDKQDSMHAYNCACIHTHTHTHIYYGSHKQNSMRGAMQWLLLWSNPLTNPLIRWLLMHLGSKTLFMCIVV